MSEGEGDSGESLIARGGIIPGAPGVPAFTLDWSDPSPIPILIAVPHAGRAYPPTLVDRMRNPGTVAIRLEDRHADKLAQRVAAATGAALLVAQAPRAMIDLNRASDDIDWSMFSRGRPEGADTWTPGRRARSGLGLIPRRLPGFGELWKRRHDEGDLADRIALIHEPYHACLAQALTRLHARWGAALLLDLHSMPPLPRQGNQPASQFVLGDRFGAACNGSLVASTFSWFASERRLIAHNRPYAGGYVLERHARPDAGINAFQLEIDRTAYLDGSLSELGPGFADTVHLLIGLVRRLAGEVAELGRMARVRADSGEGWAQAAE